MYALLLLLLNFCPAHPAHANFLTYIDEKGTKHVVQSEDEIPEKYKKDVKKSAAGDPKKSFFSPDVPYSPNPKDPPKVSCEKEATWNFDQVRKKLFGKEEGALSADELKTYGELMAKRDKEKADCAARYPEGGAKTGDAPAAPKK